jgi:FhuF-like iron-sulfur protein
LATRIGKGCFTESRRTFRRRELCASLCYARITLTDISALNDLVPMPAVAITDAGWLGDQLTAAAHRYRMDRSAAIGVLWWYSASSVLLGPLAESMSRGRAPADPALATTTLYLHPDGRVLDATATATTDDVTGHLSAMLDTAIGAVVAASGAAERALWAIATDSLANRVLWAGGSPAVAAALAAADARLPAPRYVEVGSARVVRRASCCLIYEAPGEAKCVSCPRQPPDERLRRLRAALG